MKLMTRTAAMAAAATALTLTTVPSASADYGSIDLWTEPDTSGSCNMITDAGHVEFYEYGEIVSIEDTATDGYAIAAAVRVDGEYDDTFYNTKGSGEPAYQVNRSYPEGADVDIKVYGLTSYDDDRDCGEAWADGEA